MTREETKKWVLDEFNAWPERHTFDDLGLCALTFYGWLQSNRAAKLSYASFPRSDPYQIIHGWIKEWDRSWGRIERERATTALSGKNNER